MSRTLPVADMACEGCEASVEEALREVSGVVSVDADHEAGTVTVEGDAEEEALVAAVTDAGYEASV